MINAWWAVGEAWGFVILMIWTRSRAYRAGIWDGAFNHFLPVVKREMLFYDKARAEAVFAREKEEFGL